MHEFFLSLPWLPSLDAFRNEQVHYRVDLTGRKKSIRKKSAGFENFSFTNLKFMSEMIEVRKH
jgi:hypothetical protein